MDEVNNQDIDRIITPNNSVLVSGSPITKLIATTIATNKINNETTSRYKSIVWESFTILEDELKIR
ncbi:32910_t:CDS:1, partial [Racocetra persica]